MTPEATLSLDKARDLLRQADAMLGIDLNEAAARTAYLAGMSAAQALIFEGTGRVVKTHRGVHTEFGRLARGEPTIGEEARVFLPRGYALKAIADYETGPHVKVSPDLARKTIDMARRFVAVIASLLQPTER